MDYLLKNPLILVGVGIVAIFGLLAALRYKPKKSSGIRGLDSLLSDGNYLQAGVLAEKHGRLGEAIDYYVRAQQPVRAAQAAMRAGNLRQAAELYERAGDIERAAHFYGQVGMAEKQRELRALIEAKAPTAAVSPEKKNSAAEADFRQAQANIARGGGDPAALAHAAMMAAEGLVAEGNVRKAAEVYRDAGLLDEAIHLYVNVLGAPGEAAPLLAALGHHERAAELYVLAGQKERAANVWVEHAKSSTQPEQFVERIAGLSDEVATTFLGELVRERPLARNTAGLHVRYAESLRRVGQIAQAIQVLEPISKANYEPAKKLMLTLREGMAPTGQTAEQGASPRDVAPEMRLHFNQDEIATIAKQAAQVVLAEQQRRTQLGANATVLAKPRRKQIDSKVRGLEADPLAESPLDDVVESSREGPSIETLRRLIGDRNCDLQNIEVYYRLGLALVARGDWDEARQAFDAVEEASPGYRDAERRTWTIVKWQQAIGERANLSSPSHAGKSRYHIRGELGRGGMAVVYRAVDEILGRDVALKFLVEEMSVRPEIREMFQREARAVAQLNHPNIVTIHDFGEIEGRAFIAMEYVEGATVEQAIRERGRLSVVESLRITRQVLDALAFAHERQIIHRDIKPSNMMKTTAGLVKLMDFGLAKSIDHSQRSSMVAGTPPYMPIEQFVGGVVDHRADLFAVGVSLYEMLTGRLPFQHLDRQTKPTPLRTIDPTIPEFLDEIVFRAIEPEANARFVSASAFAAPLGQVLDAVDKAQRDALPSTRGGDTLIA